MMQEEEKRGGNYMATEESGANFIEKTVSGLFLFNCPYCRVTVSPGKTFLYSGDAEKFKPLFIDVESRWMLGEHLCLLHKIRQNGNAAALSLTFKAPEDNFNDTTKLITCCRALGTGLYIRTLRVERPVKVSIGLVELPMPFIASEAQRVLNYAEKNYAENKID